VKFFGADHPFTAEGADNLASLLVAQGKYGEAEPLYKRALAIVEKTLGAEHPNVAIILSNYAELLRIMNRQAEAVKLESRVKEIRAKTGKK
jgi:tetratricopeptide (TPR) repeat protein